MRILLIEDDSITGAYVTRAMREHGHVIDLAHTGQEGVMMAGASSYDVLVVDRMLPGLDGIAVVRSIRSAGVGTPVLFLTAMAGVGDRVSGLEAGGDDYLVKPFAFSELLARLHALSRRPPLSDRPMAIVIADLHVDLLTRVVTRGGTVIALQAREYAVLAFLLRHQDRVVTRTMLLEGVWDFHFDPQTNIVDTHISRLRSKLSRNGRDPEIIHTIRGAGYLIRAPA